MYLYKKIIEKETKEKFEKLGKLKDIRRVTAVIFSKFSKNCGTTLACLKIRGVGFSSDLIFSAK